MKSLKTTFAKIRYAAYPVTNAVNNTAQRTMVEAIAITEGAACALIGASVGAVTGASFGYNRVKNSIYNSIMKDQKCLKQS